jgi:hypothetical protein
MRPGFGRRSRGGVLLVWPGNVSCLAPGGPPAGAAATSVAPAAALVSSSAAPGWLLHIAPYVAPYVLAGE